MPAMRMLSMLASCLLLAACASLDSAPAIPAGAVESTRTEANGDVVSEFRVNGQLAMVRVVPARGPTYFLIDGNGDGRLDSRRGQGPVSPVYFKLYGW